MKNSVGKSQRVKRFYRRHAVPVTVWLVAVAVVVWLLYQRTTRFETMGIARGQVLQVAASCTGRIKEIHAPLFAPVKEGQPLVTLDTVTDNELLDEAKLRADLAMAGAEAVRLSAQLIPTQEKLRADAATLQMNQKDNWRRFEMDVDSARLRILDLQRAIASGRITLEDLAVQVKISEKLLQDEAIVPLELEKIKVHHASILQNVRENEQLLEQARGILRQTQQRRDAFAMQEFPAPSEDAALEAIRRQVGVQEEIMKGLLAQLDAWQARRRVELTAPIAGRVIPIHGQRNDALLQRPGEEVVRQPGEVVRAGDPILAVAEEAPTEVVAYVSEQQLGHLRARMPVELRKPQAPAASKRSQIAEIGPTIELMPQRLWRNPTVPQWGLPVLIKVPPGLALVPGELVEIRGL
ncbi:MAG: HlyD family efflux transporter periplasmic adaptor subunit [Planctomycetes bacterium]|nr:HlyD family efflux transporter periplasmic adaptor subunit [Planctomycetota bacterium]